MKHIKLFEQFINEANELIKAQSVCKNAIFASKKIIDDFLDTVKSAGIISEYSTKVSTYNQGYELKLKLDYDFRKKLTDSEEDLLTILTGSSYIFLQPSSFFQEDIDRGEANKIEGKVISTVRNLPYNKLYPYWVIKSKSDIPRVHKEFVDIIKGQLDEMKKLINKK